MGGFDSAPKIAFAFVSNIFMAIVVTSAIYLSLHTHDLNTSPGITAMMIKPKRMRWAGHVTRMGAINAYNISVRKSEGNSPLGRPRRRWED
jgi:hypothetical protein